MPKIQFASEVNIVPLSVEFQGRALFGFGYVFTSKEASEITALLSTQLEVRWLIQA